jgi:hypothetical protein
MIVFKASKEKGRTFVWTSFGIGSFYFCCTQTTASSSGRKVSHLLVGGVLKSYERKLILKRKFYCDKSLRNIRTESDFHAHLYIFTLNTFWITRGQTDFFNVIFKLLCLCLSFHSFNFSSFYFPLYILRKFQ